jgi:DNA repair protein RecO (recombination protein O)
MSAEKAQALVLRTVEFSETSLVATLFTREFGKVRGLAKGARRLKGPFDNALDLLAACRIVFLRKSSGGLDLFTEARLERRFRPAGRSLASLYAAYYVGELLELLTDEHDPHPELFDAATEALAGLSLGEPIAPRLLRFELTGLGWLGHLPSLEQCVECGRPVEAGARVAFSLQAGGVLCARCRPGKKQVVSVSSGVLKAMARFADSGSDLWRRVELDQRTRGELRAVLNHYLASLLGRQPRMHAWLGDGA